MFASTITVALASFLVSIPAESIWWHTDYGIAQSAGKEGHKPLAVFIGSGKAGWNQLARERQLGDKVKQLLAKDYICVYVDTAIEMGRDLASEFQVNDPVGLIVSDHTGNYQAFRHKGDLPDEQLLRYLTRYADPQRIVRSTETNPSEQVDIYPPQNHATRVGSYYQPLRYPTSYSVGGGRSC
jgi:hypothetical protein